MIATFTREQFDEACQEFIRSVLPESSAYQTKHTGWSWKEHNVRRRYIVRFLFHEFRYTDIVRLRVHASHCHSELAKPGIR